MLATALIAGFTLGAAGSLHCIGMCGPLSLALPINHLSPTGKFVSLFLYQLGRIITYAILGLIFGLAGKTMYLAGMQEWFSIVLGMTILILAGSYFIQKNNISFPWLGKLYSSVLRIIAGLLKRNAGLSSFLLLGMANGLLPCSMVYIALAATLSLTQLQESIGFMAMFGAGTLPAMMLIGYGARLVTPGIRRTFKKAVPIFITATGIILILRGLNLGSMISHEFHRIAGDIIGCAPPK